MKIQSISSFYNYFNKNNYQSSVININSFRQQTGDIVSFSSKQYNADAIVNPTNHCAYCGCKLYNDAQIESIAKEILTSKGARLEGKVRSVLEKLTDAKHSQELAIAKRMENKDEIDFFNKFLDISSKRSYLKGEEIFKQVYHQETEEANKTLITNMRPLLKTIDHVTPQREEKENINSDINLVEACYCCNHDLKKGASFNEFYAMFPSIKNNMPNEKFKYASEKLMDSSQSQILQRLSASNMLKFLERLFVQRTEAKNELDSVDYRIKGCKEGIQSAIQSCRDEISEKEAEKDKLEQKFVELKQDPEYEAMLERVSLQAKLESQNTELDASRVRRHKLNDSLNALKGASKHSKNKIRRNVQEMSEEEKRQKAEQIKSDIQLISAQIEEQENKKFEIELSIAELNEKYPTIEEIQTKKNKADAVINAYGIIDRETKILQEKQEQKTQMEQEAAALKDELSKMPEASSSFSIDNFPEEIQAEYKRYKDLVEALAYIDEHQNGGVVRGIIHSSARTPIAEEIEKLKNNDAVVAYKNYEHKKELNSRLEKIQKSIFELTGQINQSERLIANNKKIIAGTTLEETKQKSEEYTEKIRQLLEKQNYIKMPQNIARIKAEIDLLEQTIKDLITQQKKIEESYTTA